MKPRWISRFATLEFHAEQLAEHGGADGIRDSGRLDAALSRPQTILAYAPDVDIAALASAYAHGISKGHPFIDGNKRTAWVVARTFLLLNNVTIIATQDERYNKMYALASGELTETEFAEWLRGVSAPRK